MTTKTVRRRADIPAEEAIAGLIKKFPNARLAGFKREGDLYVAQLVTAEFPPPSDDDGDEGGPPHAEPDADDFGGPPDGDEDDEPKSDDDGEKKSPPKKDGESKGKGGVEKEMLDVLKAIAEALGAPVPGDEGAVPGESDGPVPPPHPAGPPAPPVADKKAPLPPPAAPSGGGLGGLGAPMAKTIVSRIAKEAAGRRSVVVWRPLEGLTLKQATAEIRAELPDFELKKYERKMGRINGGEPQPVIIAALVRK